MKFKPTIALEKINTLLANDSDVFIIQGGQGAGKTISILMLLLDVCRNKTKSVSIVSQELTKLKITAVRDFVELLKDWGLFEAERWNKTSNTYTFANGSYIEFIGLDKKDVGKGLRRDIVYFNEANKIDQESYIQVASRSKINILDFNPDKRFFAHDLINENNFISLTYKDNEFLPIQEVKAIENYKAKGFINANLKQYDTPNNIKSNYWANKWRVYGMGKVGSLDGLIFDYTEIQTIPEDARLLGYGMDFGYSNDPTTLIGVYSYNDTYILDQLIYKVGLTNQDIANELKQFGIKRNELIIADSSEPKSIAEINRFGFAIKGAVKGSDSILNGIQLMQTKEIQITKRSQETIQEFGNYVWDKDRNGQQLNKPIGADHSIDAVRYLISSIEQRKPIKVRSYL